MMRTKKAAKYSIQYRVNGNWIECATRTTKKLAQEFAKASGMCQRNGYQIVSK